MSLRIAGAHVAVVGGSRGVGRALGRAFAEAGARVTLVARDPDRLATAAKEIDAGAVVADLADEREVRGLVARLEDVAPVDVLVGNAALDACGPFDELGHDPLRELFAVNVVAPALLCRDVLPGMRRRGRGRLVLVSSLSAHATLPGLTAYSATKAAVSRLGEGLRTELRGSGVGVTVVETGPVATDMYATIRRHPSTAAAFDRLLATRAVRLLDPGEVAEATVGAVRRGTGTLVLPRRARAQAALARLPERTTAATLRGAARTA